MNLAYALPFSRPQAAGCPVSFGDRGESAR